MLEQRLDLLERISQDQFGFSLRGWKEPVAAFFAPTVENELILSERRRWLKENPEQYLVYGPAAGPLLDETLAVAAGIDPDFSSQPGDNPGIVLRRLAEHWEADFILCQKDFAGRICMQAGAVCFPSYWAPETKLGLPVEALHGVVPGLNAAIGPKIHNLLERLPAGYAWLRVNWGLSASAERNQHPLSGVPRLKADTPFDGIFLRLEYQALLRLPATGGILFGIRPYSYHLETVRAYPQVARALAGQLRSMPLDVQTYKGIDGVAAKVVGFLHS